MSKSMAANLKSLNGVIVHRGLYRGVLEGLLRGILGVQTIALNPTLPQTNVEP